MSDEIDPEIAALISGEIEEYSIQSMNKKTVQSQSPSYESLFGEMDLSAEADSKSEFDVNLSKKTYTPVENFESNPPNSFLSDPQYYQKALAGEGENSQRFHELLKKYLHASDPKDKGLYRQQIITSYWNMVSNMIPRIIGNKPVIPKQLMVRYGMALPTMILEDQRSIFSKIVYKKAFEETVYYTDEWLRNVALGNINKSSTDEVKQSRGDERVRINTFLQKAIGKRDSVESMLKAKADERRVLEGMLRERVDLINEHAGLPGFYQIPAPYTESQKKTITELSEIVKKLLAADKELVSSVAVFEDAAKDVQTLKEKAGSLGTEEKADLQALSEEFDTIRQMHKMCVGRQGNHFPLITKEYFHLNLREIGTRENVIDTLAWLESIDAEAFSRPYKSTLNRIEPFIILLPSYGDVGICWEPFDKFNRHTSRSRLAIPMYPKNLRIAIAVAVADMRWQFAKEKASYYWMEEGITGNYYQWFLKQKLKGDVKEFFIQDYISWITKESEGMQKLDKEVRAIFWRLIPFTQPVKDKLRDRSLVYQELYQRDVNKSLSDGY
ncbi:hypothetical protein MASR2M29_10460 [Spirochaetota bacterium]